MDSQCLRVRLLPGKTEVFLAWARTLAGRTDEVRHALAAEGMHAELVFLQRTADGDYVTLYTQAADLAAANRAFELSSLAVDEEAKRVMAETWDLSSVVVLERLLEVVGA